MEKPGKTTKQQPEKKQQDKNNQQQPKKKRRQGGAPRRGGYSRRGTQVAANNKISTEKSLVVAQGVKQTITITSTFDSLSIQLIPCGLLSMAMSKGLLGVSYSVYKVITADYVSLMQSGNGSAPSRFRYLNDIYGSFVPKNIPFRNNGAIQLALTTFSFVPADNIGVNGGLTYYMWVTTTFGPWSIQTAPPSTSPEQDVANYLMYQTLLTGRAKHNSIERNIALTKKYLRDGSAFARNAPYYGIGGGVGSPYGSIEFEVPFKSKFLGTFITYDPTTPRVSRVLDKTSGDACSNYGIGILDEFNTSYYQGAVPPIYKFLDIAEVAATLAMSMTTALTAYYSSILNQGLSSGLTFLDNGFTFTYQVFLLMLRQQLLWVFSDSQCLGQFQSFEVGNNAFLAFLCGSNCCPQEPSTKLKIPSVLNENLKMLKKCIRPYKTKEYQSKRNHVTHIPIWGAYDGAANPGFFYNNSQGVVKSLFDTENVGPFPSIFDGVMGNMVIDLNTSSIITEAVTEWNDWVAAITNMFAGIDVIGGDSAGSPLLQFTRYVNYQTEDSKKITGHQSEITLQPRQRVPPSYYPYVKEVKVERKDSKGKLCYAGTPERILAIPNSTVMSEFTAAISGCITITATHKQYFPQLILPIIDLDSMNGLPTQNQVQVSSIEPFSVFKNIGEGTTFASRWDEISSGMNNMVVGLSGKKSPLSDFIKALSDNNQGGFLGDLFSFVGDAANSVGFTGVGAVASTLGSIGNALDI